MFDIKKTAENDRRAFSRYKHGYITATDAASERELEKTLIDYVEKEEDRAIREMRAGELVNLFRIRGKILKAISIASYASKGKQEAFLNSLIERSIDPEVVAAITASIENLHLSTGLKKRLAHFVKMKKAAVQNAAESAPQKEPPPVRVKDRPSEASQKLPSLPEQRPKDKRATTQFRRHMEAVRSTKEVFEKGFFRKKWGEFLEFIEKRLQRKKEPLNTPFRRDIKSLKATFKKGFWKRLGEAIHKFLTQTPGP